MGHNLTTNRRQDALLLTLANALPSKERPKSLKSWGLLFESYVNWLLKKLDGRHLPCSIPTAVGRMVESRSTLFSSKKEVESNRGFLPQVARYSNDLATFLSILEERIGEGCHQLARDIGAFFHDEGGEEQNLRSVTTPRNLVSVLPILVVQDPMLRTPFVNYFLNQKFKSKHKGFPTKERIEILPLSVIQVTDLENLIISAESRGTDVLNLLRRRCRLSPDMLMEVEEAISMEVKQRAHSSTTTFEELFRKSSSEMMAILFKADENAQGEGRLAFIRSTNHLAYTE